MEYYYLRGTKDKHECNLLQFRSSSQSCGIILLSKKDSKYRSPLFEYGYHTKETENISESNFYALFKGLEHALENDIYDLILVLNYNMSPTIKFKGSAIFIHVAKKNYKPTAGCIGLKKKDLINLVSKINIEEKVIIQ
jgi:hypothetical protein